MKYIHKPTEVEAIQYTGDMESLNDVVTFCGAAYSTVVDDTLHIKNPNGDLVVNEGDYVIKGEKDGDYWVCTEDVFEKSYDSIHKYDMDLDNIIGEKEVKE